MSLLKNFALQSHQSKLKLKTHNTNNKGKKMNRKKSMTKKEKMLYRNDLNWRVVTYDDGDVCVVHDSGLSNILECGHDMKEYGIIEIMQCWNGDDLRD